MDTTTLPRTYYGIESESGRTPAWHNLGERSISLTEDASVRDMFNSAALLGWNLRLVETPSVGRTSIESYDVVRDNPWDGLPDTIGRVGSRYHLFDNEEVLDLVENLTHGDATPDLAISFRNGSSMLATVRLGSTLIDPDGAADQIEKYLLVSTSHDGSKNIQASIIGLRVWCMNSLNIAHKGAAQSFKIRHTASAQGRIEEARKALGMSELYFDAFSRDMHKLMDVQVTNDKAQAIFESAYAKPDADNKRGLTRWENQLDTLWDIYNGPTLENVHGTAYGVFNALEERLDWHRTSRTGNDQNIFAASSGFDVRINAEKNRLFDLVSSV